MTRGLDALGWHVDSMPRNVRGCDQGENCGLLRVRLPARGQAVDGEDVARGRGGGGRADPGADVRAQRVLVGERPARGVEAESRSDGHRVDRARRGRSSRPAGAIHTPALLRRSGLGNREHRPAPAAASRTAVCGVFDEELRPWEGTMQALYSDEHRRPRRRGYGVKYETAAIHPCSC